MIIYNIVIPHKLFYVISHFSGSSTSHKFILKLHKHNPTDNRFETKLLNIRYFSEERNRRFVSRNPGPSFANIMDALTHDNNTSIEGDLNIDNVAAVQPIIVS